MEREPWLEIARSAARAEMLRLARRIDVDSFEDIAANAVADALGGYDSTRGSLESRIGYFAQLGVRRHFRNLSFDHKELPVESATLEVTDHDWHDVLWPGFALSVYTPAERRQLLSEWGLGIDASAVSRHRFRRRRANLHGALERLCSGRQSEREWAAFALAHVAGRGDADGLDPALIRALADEGLRRSRDGEVSHPAVVQLGCIWAAKRLDPDAWDDRWLTLLEPEVLPDALMGALGNPSISNQLPSKTTDILDRATALALRGMSCRREDPSAIWAAFDVVRIAADTLGGEAAHLVKGAVPASTGYARQGTALVLSRTGNPEAALEQLHTRKPRDSWIEAVENGLRGRLSFERRVYADLVRRLELDEKDRLVRLIVGSPHVFIRHSGPKICRDLGTGVPMLERQLRRIDRRSSYLARSCLGVLRSISPRDFVLLVGDMLHSTRWSHDSWLLHDAAALLYDVSFSEQDPHLCSTAAQIVEGMVMDAPRGFCPFLFGSLAHLGYFNDRPSKTFG